MHERLVHGGDTEHRGNGLAGPQVVYDKVDALALCGGTKLLHRSPLRHGEQLAELIGMYSVRQAAAVVPICERGNPVDSDLSGQQT